MDFQFESLLLVFMTLIIILAVSTIGFYLQKKVFTLRVNNPMSLKILDYSTLGLCVALLVLVSTDLKYSILSNIVALVALVTATASVVMAIYYKIRMKEYLLLQVLALLFVILYFCAEFHESF